MHTLAKVATVLAKVATVLAKIATVLVATTVVVIVVLMLAYAIAYAIAASGYNPFEDGPPRRGFSLAAGGAPRANLGH